MYKITFIDNSVFYGGQNLYNTLWDKIPNKSIKGVDYDINNNKICLFEYEQYNHLIEKILIDKIIQISRIILMGRIKNEVTCMIYDLKENKWSKKITEWGKEYNNAPTTGWKIGITR